MNRFGTNLANDGSSPQGAGNTGIAQCCHKTSSVHPRVQEHNSVSALGGLTGFIPRVREHESTLERRS